MGEIYEAVAPDVGRRVAVKRVLDADHGDQNLKLLFLREVAVAATLEHHHVVEVLDAGTFGGELFLVMELVDGPSLAEILDVLYRESKLMPVDVACGILSQVSVGLAHAHERALPDGTPLGIIHRDVAVENILVGQDGVPKVLDFGLAKLSGHSLTEPGIVRGRPRSLSPEQARGEQVDARSDIFAMGAILFELVTGDQLYPNEAMASLLWKVAAGDYEPIVKRVPPHTDPELVRIIETALAVDPSQRFRSARQMGRALAAFRAARGLRMSSQAVAELVRETFPKVQQIRAQGPAGGRGALEESTIELPADPDARARREHASSDDPPAEVRSDPPGKLGSQPPAVSPPATRRPMTGSMERMAEEASNPVVDGGSKAHPTPSVVSTDSALPLPSRPVHLSEEDRARRQWRAYGLVVLLLAGLLFAVIYRAHPKEGNDPPPAVQSSSRDSRRVLYPTLF